MAHFTDPDPALKSTSALNRPLSEAADWFARLSHEDVTEADFVAFREWREVNQDHANAYDQISSLWDEVGDHGDAPSIVEMRLAALAEQAGGMISGPKLMRVGAIAGSVALAFAAAAFFYSGSYPLAGSGEQTGTSEIAQASTGASGETSPTTENVAEATSEPSVFGSVYSTEIGQMAQFTLPDGSVVELNTGSEFQVNYSAAERNLVLVKGEAVFTVAKDAARPFIVAAGNSRIVALGTIFSVRKHDTNAEVTLIEGRVRVDSNDPSAEKKTTYLAPGEHLNIVPRKPFAISKTEPSQIASWRDRRLVFERAPLADVLSEFNRYSIEQHVIADDSLRGLLVSGTFRIKSSEHFAATLEAGFPVQVRARSGGTVFEVTAAQD